MLDRSSVYAPVTRSKNEAERAENWVGRHSGRLSPRGKKPKRVNSVNTSVSCLARMHSEDCARWQRRVTLLLRQFRSNIWDSHNDIVRFSSWP